MTKMLTATQQAGMESGYELMEATELLTTYLHQLRLTENDEHMIHVLNIVSLAVTKFDGAYNAAYMEHEAAEDAAAQPTKVIALVAGKVAHRSRKVVSK